MTPTEAVLGLQEWFEVFRRRGKGNEPTVKEFLEAAALIEKLDKRVPRWISVEEKLPGSDCDWVLAIGKFVPENTYGKPIISELRKDGKWWGDINDEFPLEDMGIRITHWMPLPEPPTKEK